jgi:hypothetical protein
VVVVCVGEQYRVDPTRGLGMHGDAPAEVGHEDAQKRIGQQAHAVERDEDRGVTDPAYARGGVRESRFHQAILGPAPGTRRPTHESGLKSPRNGAEEPK